MADQLLEKLRTICLALPEELEAGGVGDPTLFMQSKVKGNAIMVPFENASHALLFSHGKQFTKELMHFLQSQ